MNRVPKSFHELSKTFVYLKKSFDFTQFSKLYFLGLFHKGFSHSGTVTAPWALQRAPLTKARQLAASLGCVDDSSTKNIIDCMRQRPAYQIVANTKQFYVYGLFPIVPFAPTVEIKSDEAFISDHPYNLLVNGPINDVPWINMFTSEDGLFIATCKAKAKWQ